ASSTLRSDYNPPSATRQDRSRIHTVRGRPADTDRRVDIGCVVSAILVLRGSFESKREICLFIFGGRSIRSLSRVHPSSRTSLVGLRRYPAVDRPRLQSGPRICPARQLLH